MNLSEKAANKYLENISNRNTQVHPSRHKVSGWSIDSCPEAVPTKTTRTPKAEPGKQQRS